VTKRIKLASTVRCPECGFQSKEQMPTDFCLIRYECKMCGYVMIQTEGKCCIFCSFGDVPCPPVQKALSADS
jgi:rubredoxin